MIDGFTRYGFLGVSDGNVSFGLIYLIILSIVVWFLSYYLFKKGYKIKSKKMSSLAKNYNRRKISFKKGKGSFFMQPMEKNI